MYCDEKIINVFLGQNEYDDIEGSNCWFDCYHDIAFHTTEGYRLILETDNHMLSLGVKGVIIQNKNEFKPYDNEWLEETVHIWEEENENGKEKDTIVDLKNTLFVGQRLCSVKNGDGYFLLKFDDFEMKLIPYDLGDDIPSLTNADHWSYNYVLGFDRFLEEKCPFCGGNGEILLDFVSDFVVRCKQCNKSTCAEMEVRHAIENWNKGEVQCDLSDITIE